MAAFRRTVAVVAVGFALAELIGCAMPQGPIQVGGLPLGRCLGKCCHYCAGSSGTCDENDPQIVPPHSNFHPLPTRPVFSRPEGFEPLPANDPLRGSSAPATPLEVQNERRVTGPSVVGNTDRSNATESPSDGNPIDLSMRPSLRR
jgi:hypothetical protein